MCSVWFEYGLLTFIESFDFDYGCDFSRKWIPRPGHKPCRDDTYRARSFRQGVRKPRACRRFDVPFR
ncbi:hypothetical protein BO443_190009 [Burkholderia orbicola]